MQKNICHISTCVNYQRYCRTHLQDEPKEMKVATRDYLKARKEFLSKHKTCQVPGCTRPAKEIHHRRGRLASLLIEAKYFLAVCRPCHRWIEENPHAAKADGLSESRHKKHAI